MRAGPVTGPPFLIGEGVRCPVVSGPLLRRVGEAARRARARRGRRGRGPGSATDHGQLTTNDPPNKETFRRGREGFFLFRALRWSQGPKRNVVTVFRTDQEGVGVSGWSHVPDGEVFRLTSSWWSSWSSSWTTS